jgi:hypothetical protein
LTYAWSLNAKPDGSQAALVGSDSVTPHLTPDNSKLEALVCGTNGANYKSMSYDALVLKTA